MAESLRRLFPRVSPKGRIVGLGLATVGLLITLAGLLSLAADFNPPDLQLLRQAGPCTAAQLADGENCYQTLTGRVGSAQRGGTFLSPNASFDLKAADREGTVVVGLGPDAALPASGSSLLVEFWRERMVAVQVGGRWYPTSEVPQPVTDNVGVVGFSLVFAVAMIWFAVRLLSGRAGALDYFG